MNNTQKKKFPPLAYNSVSVAGAIIALTALLIIIFLFVVDVLSSRPNPYYGIFLYMVMPLVLIFGLVLIPVGMYKAYKRRKAGEGVKPDWPKVDLNNKSERNAFFIFFFGTIIFLGMTAVGSFEAYHFSDSVTFCGRICHTIMKPEYTAYQHSPHARVACVECHVGPGAGWYVKSKLSGAYQVYATIAGIYPRPIPTPIKSLRPARETCEQCHWPDKFSGSAQRIFSHYMYDSSNTNWSINMLVDIGGGSRQTGPVGGIHWHVSPGIHIQYIARDKERQDIPWVRVTYLDSNRSTIYTDQENPPTDKEVASGEMRLMDCVDCHNRPSHIYRSPDYAIDQSISLGRIDPAIPNIKSVAVEVMNAKYDSQKDALKQIAGKIDSVYKIDYSSFYKADKKKIQQAIRAVQDDFSIYMFPYMKVRWSVYPDNIGHFFFLGCYRCHDGNHADTAGEKVSHDCDNCHSILAQGKGKQEQISSTLEGLEFKHPEDIFEAWKEMGCHECHTGTKP
jgi:nitrate/TMAO reductase-like tetraheme cytochrome c subunit